MAGHHLSEPVGIDHQLAFRVKGGQFDAAEAAG